MVNLREIQLKRKMLCTIVALSFCWCSPSFGAMNTLEEVTNPAYTGDEETTQGGDIEDTANANAVKSNINFTALAAQEATKWAADITYTTGNTFVAHEGKFYICKEGHLSSSLTEPGVGANTDNAWTLKGEDQDISGIATNAGNITTNTNKRIVSGVMIGSGIVFTRTDATTFTVDANTLFDNTDAQDITSLSIDGSYILTVGITGGDSDTVDLSALVGGGLADAPNDGTVYARQNETWVAVTGSFPGFDTLVNDYSFDPASKQDVMGTDDNYMTDAQIAALHAVVIDTDTHLTNAQVKTAYESNAETNALTDAEKAALHVAQTGSTLPVTDEFANSDGTNAQDVLDDLDAAIDGKQAAGIYVTSDAALHIIVSDDCSGETLATGEVCLEY